ncbi:MAG: nicotinate-nicotinamide nucleotide adenylyltransferase [Buchnera aphidicola (Floraphis meitanensis)]
MKYLRKTIGYKQSLGFIIGLDNLINLDKWHQWQELLKWCHLIILRRSLNKQYTQNNILKNWIQNHATTDYSILNKNPFGHIFFSNTPYIDISSTQIRKLVKNKYSCAHLLPVSIINYIQKHKLYI